MRLKRAVFVADMNHRRWRDIEKKAILVKRIRKVFIVATSATIASEMKKATYRRGLLYSGSPTWTRTRDLRINSPSLYRLSYQGKEALL
jgi:hypothetical protein